MVISFQGNCFHKLPFSGYLDIRLLFAYQNDENFKLPLYSSSVRWQFLKTLIKFTSKPWLDNMSQASLHSCSKLVVFHMKNLISHISHIVDELVIFVANHQMDHHRINQKVKFIFINNLTWRAKNFFVYLIIHFALINFEFGINLSTIGG